MDFCAGDPAFGLVSGYLGRRFTGIELRQEQVDFNLSKAKDVGLLEDVSYICDDGRNVGTHIKPKSMDFVFSCPPYYDLEIYSEKREDLPNMETYEEFMGALAVMIKGAVKALNKNRFMALVVGDIRDENGVYRSFPGEYNSLIYIEVLASAPLRARTTFKHRKVVKTHQDVMVFIKGNTEQATNRLAPVEVGDIGEI
jgi:DNA modification methylase